VQLEAYDAHKWWMMLCHYVKKRSPSPIKCQNLINLDSFLKKNLDLELQLILLPTDIMTHVHSGECY